MSWITAEQPGSSDVGPDGLVRDDLVTAYRETVSSASVASSIRTRSSASGPAPRRS